MVLIHTGSRGALHRALRLAPRATCAAALVCALPLPGLAQAPSPTVPLPDSPLPVLTQARAWRVVPVISLTETYTDNIGISADELARRGWITDIAPGLILDVNTARLKMNLDYRYHRLLYSDSQFANSTQQSLTSSATFEAIEKRLFIDASAGIVGENRSPFSAAVSADRPTANANRLETRTVQVSPYIRGQILDFAAYQVRYNASDVRTDNDVLPATRVGELAARVRNATYSARIGWAIDVSSLAAKNDVVGTTDDSRIRASIIYSVDPLLNFSASIGHESTDFLGPQRETSDNPGVGFTWNPSARAQMGAIVEKRFFGTGHSALFIYRTPISALKLVSTRDAAVLPGVVASVASASIAGVLNDLLTSTIPDPTERARAARAQLEQTGVSSGFPLSTGFVTVTPQIIEALAASFVMTGTRNTITASLARTSQRRALSLAAAGLPEDPLAGDGGIRQTGLNGTWSYKLTPKSTVTLNATTFRSEQLTLQQLTSRQTDFSLYFTSQMGPKTAATFGVRHSSFDAPLPLISTTENAVFGSFQIKL